MQQQISAELKCLEYKLDAIRSMIRSRVDSADDYTKVELSLILAMIARYEEVPAGWHLEEPIVKRIEEDITNG